MFAILHSSAITTSSPTDHKISKIILPPFALFAFSLTVANAESCGHGATIIRARTTKNLSSDSVSLRRPTDCPCFAVESGEENNMAKYLNLKVKYEEELRRIPATHVTKQHGRLSIYDGEKLVGEFSEEKVEYWSLDEAAKS